MRVLRQVRRPGVLRRSCSAQVDAYDPCFLQQVHIHSLCRWMCVDVLFSIRPRPLARCLADAGKEVGTARPIPTVDRSRVDGTSKSDLRPCVLWSYILPSLLLAARRLCGADHLMRLPEPHRTIPAVLDISSARRMRIAQA